MASDSVFTRFKRIRGYSCANEKPAGLPDRVFLLDEKRAVYCVYDSSDLLTKQCIAQCVEYVAQRHGRELIVFSSNLEGASIRALLAACHGLPRLEFLPFTHARAAFVDSPEFVPYKRMSREMAHRFAQTVACATDSKNLIKYSLFPKISNTDPALVCIIDPIPSVGDVVYRRQTGTVHSQLNASLDVRVVG